MDSSFIFGADKLAVLNGQFGLSWIISDSTVLEHNLSIDNRIFLSRYIRCSSAAYISFMIGCYVTLNDVAKLQFNGLWSSYDKSEVK